MNTPTEISILIVEDQALIADHIALCLTDAGYAVAGICDNGKDAIQLLATTNPSLVLLDINLAGGVDGVDIAHVINDKHQIPFIFLTSNADLRTIERVKLTNPAGFIIKPYTMSDLQSSIEIALHNHKTKRASLKSSIEDDGLFVKENHRFRRIEFRHILYVKANDNYTSVETETEKIVLSVPLKIVEEKLGGQGFIRTHRSYLVNIKKIEAVNPKSVFIKGKEIPLSESYKNDLMSRLNLL